MEIVYEIWRDLIVEYENGEPNRILQHDKLYATESYEDAWKKYFELRSGYVFQWTKQTRSVIKFVRNES